MENTNSKNDLSEFKEIEEIRMVVFRQPCSECQKDYSFGIWTREDNKIIFSNKCEHCHQLSKFDPEQAKEDIESATSLICDGYRPINTPTVDNSLRM